MPAGSALGVSGGWPQLVAGALVAWWSDSVFRGISELLAEHEPRAFSRWIADPLASCDALSPFVAGVLLAYAALCLALGRARGRYSAAGGLLASGAATALVVWRMIDPEAAPGAPAQEVLLGLGTGLAALALVARSTAPGAGRGLQVAVFIACVLPGGWQVSNRIAPAVVGSFASTVGVVLGLLATAAVIAAAVVYRRSTARDRALTILLPGVDAFVAWGRVRLTVLALPFLMMVAGGLLDDRHLAGSPLLFAGIWWSMILAIPMTTSLAWSLRHAASDGASAAIGTATSLLLLRGAIDVFLYMWAAEPVVRGRLDRDDLGKLPYVLGTQAIIVLLAEAAVVWHARERLSSQTDETSSGAPKLVAGWSLRLMSLGALLLIERVAESDLIGSVLTLLVIVVVLAGADLWFLQQLEAVAGRPREAPETPPSE